MAGNTKRLVDSKVAPWWKHLEDLASTRTIHAFDDGSTIQITASYQVKKDSLGLEKVVGKGINAYLSTTEHFIISIEGIGCLEEGYGFINIQDMRGEVVGAFPVQCGTEDGEIYFVPTTEQDVAKLVRLFCSGEHFRFNVYTQSSKDAKSPAISFLLAGSRGFKEIREKIVGGVGVACGQGSTLPTLSNFIENGPDLSKVRPIRSYRAGSRAAYLLKDVPAIGEELIGRPLMISYPFVLAIVNGDSTRPTSLICLEKSGVGIFLGEFREGGRHGNLGKFPSAPNEESFILEVERLLKERFGVVMEPCS